MKNLSNILVGGFVAFVIAFSLMAFFEPALAQFPPEVFNSIRVDHDADINGDLDVDGTTSLDVTGIDGAVTANSGVTVAGVLAVDDTDNALTGAQTITPTYSYLQVAPIAVLTITLATGSAVDGDLLVIQNTVATNTNIIDTGATAGGGAIDLGLNDLAVFIFGNTKWIEIASPDNS